MNIVVTGAGKGIGLELVKQFAALGEHTIIGISRSEKDLKALEETCKNIPGTQVYTISCDLTSLNLDKDLTEKIIEKVSSVDVLINNAGALLNRFFEEIKYDELRYIYEVNVFAPFRIIQSLLPLITKSEKAHIVNISSMGGFQGSAKFPGLSAYSSSKAAIASLTECLAEEFKSKNVAVNCLAIGAVQTEMLSKAFPGYQAPLTAAQMAKYIVDFSLTGHNYYNGKILPVSSSTP